MPEKSKQLSSVPMSSVTNLTYEQGKELLMMQMQHEKCIQQRELEVEVLKQQT